MFTMKRRALAAVAAAAVMSGVVAGTAMTAASAAQGAVVRYRVITKTFVVQPGTERNFTVNCLTGLVPTGGGGHAGNGSFFGGPLAGIFASDISPTHRGWTVSADVAGGVGPTSFTADVVCAAL
jgi:hypothetical protein